MAVKLQSQLSKVAGFRLRKRGEEKDAEDDELDPVRVRLHLSQSGLGDQLRQVDVVTDMEVDREDGNPALSTGAPECGCGPQPEMIPVPDSSTLSVQLPTPQQSKVPPQRLESSFDRTCAPSRAPRADGAQYWKLTWGRLHDQCSRQDNRINKSKAVSKTRLSTMGAVEAKRILEELTHEYGKRERAPANGGEGLG